MNNTSDGRTSQTMLCAKAATGSLSPVSRCSQMKASSDVSGREARSAAQSELRLASSETATMTTADTATLIMYGHIAIAAPNKRSQPATDARAKARRRGVRLSDGLGLRRSKPSSFDISQGKPARKHRREHAVL